MWYLQYVLNRYKIKYTEERDVHVASDRGSINYERRDLKSGTNETRRYVDRTTQNKVPLADQEVY